MKTTGDIYKDIKEARFNYRVGRMKEELIKLNDKKWFSEEEIRAVMNEIGINFQEEATTKWNCEKEREIALIQLSVVRDIEKKLFGGV